MRIVYHLGAHCTDESRLVHCLLKNRVALGEEGIAVPSPTRYRRLLRDTAVQLKGQTASEDTQAMILEQIMETPTAERLVLSWSSFLSFPVWAVRGNLYGFAGERVRAFTQIFPDMEAEFHLALRNPATFLPALQKVIQERGHEATNIDADPMDLRWSDAVAQILRHNPGVPLTVWCDEDTPLIWPEVLRAVSGHSPDITLTDSDEILAMVMTEAGFARMKAYCAEHPPATVSQRRRIATAFLEKFARPDQIEFEANMPGWTDDTVARLTELYLQDVERISQMPGVRMIEP